MAATDFDSEIKQLQATMRTIGFVLNVDGMRAEIADLAARCHRAAIEGRWATPRSALWVAVWRVKPSS